LGTSFCRDFITAAPDGTQELGHCTIPFCLCELLVSLDD
jgi:hypothetical protein